MNSKFQEYAFGRSFNINLSDNMVALLASLCQGSRDPNAIYGYTDGSQGLLRRGLIEPHRTAEGHTLFRPTRAGALVFDLMVEAGEYAVMESRRRETLEAEWAAEREEWDRRSGEIKIRLKDKYRAAADFSPTGEA